MRSMAAMRGLAAIMSVAMALMWLNGCAAQDGGVLAPPSPAPARTPIPLDTRGVLYCWDFSDVMENRGALERIIAERGVTALYMHFTGEFLEAADDTFIGGMADEGVEVVFLCGDPGWALEEDAASMRKAIDSVLLFNLKSRNPIAGVAFDVEPHAAESYRSDRDWYVFALNLRKAYRYASDNGLRVVAVIPFWLDSIDENGKLLDYIVQNCCDEISVMNYGVGNTAANILGEVDAARKYDKPVTTIYETRFGQGGEYFASYEAVEADYRAIHDAAQYARLRPAYHHFGDMK